GCGNRERAVPAVRGLIVVGSMVVPIRNLQMVPRKRAEQLPRSASRHEQERRQRPAAHPGNLCFILDPTQGSVPFLRPPRPPAPPPAPPWPCPPPAPSRNRSPVRSVAASASFWTGRLDQGKRRRHRRRPPRSTKRKGSDPLGGPGPLVFLPHPLAELWRV